MCEHIVVIVPATVNAEFANGRQGDLHRNHSWNRYNIGIHHGIRNSDAYCRLGARLVRHIADIRIRLK